ncbi:LysR family transcriptional regulator [Rhodobacter sp. NTK016B]|uniref:LysR family transcriptional regulator n=1 Tax=Rhodobacter sp. NTK016B TaxID=2759676 RepID=UPI001A8C5B5B|nr:LysR family transcriptional regulator [Rhodobacter sp. NTK016B]MBN8292307.1 LysR family transcriptional regulator [Rhodobacter sp. NTK016B]
MTLEQLRIFLAVARLEHVTRAAKQLNLTQSAVSAALSALETQHGVPLFDRVGRGIALNEAGRGFLPRAEEVMRRVEDAARWLADLRGGETGSLRLQASQTVASYVLPRHLMRFRARHPGIALSFRQGNTAQVLAALRAGEADLGLVEGRIDGADFETEMIGGDRLVLLTAPDHAWQRASGLTAAELARGDWVLREPGSGTRAQFDEAMQDQGIAPIRPVLELPSNEACIAAVETGHGATVLSALAAAPHLDRGHIRAAPFAFPERLFHAVRHRARHQSRAAGLFLDLLHER